MSNSSTICKYKPIIYKNPFKANLGTTQTWTRHLSTSVLQIHATVGPSRHTKREDVLRWVDNLRRYTRGDTLGLAELPWATAWSASLLIFSAIITDVIYTYN